MNTTRKTLSALALASAAALATSTFASANPGNVHGPNGASLTPGVQSHGGNTSTVSRNPGVPTQPPGQVISCHPGTGCTRSPTQPPVDKDHDRDHDYDHDHDRDHEDGDDDHDSADAEDSAAE